MRSLFLAALLSACGLPAPPPVVPQAFLHATDWQTTLYGVTVTTRLVAPGALGGQDGLAYTAFAHIRPEGRFIEVDVALSRGKLTRVVAHEWGHHFQWAFGLPGIPRPDIDARAADPQEGYAETYARAYVAACGDSLRPLGWADFNVPSCGEAPDPRSITEAT